MILKSGRKMDHYPAMVNSKLYVSKIFLQNKWNLNTFSLLS